VVGLRLGETIQRQFVAIEHGAIQIAAVEAFAVLHDGLMIGGENHWMIIIVRLRDGGEMFAGIITLMKRRIVMDQQYAGGGLDVAVGVFDGDRAELIGPLADIDVHGAGFQRDHHGEAAAIGDDLLVIVDERLRVQRPR
jgi:hypothetical protein